MPAIPTSDMPGHRALHDRVCAALNTCVESEGIDFKESAPWQTLEFKIIRTAMAMGNLRDGGVIIIGASERGSSWALSGIAPADLETYDVDDVASAINKYSSPPVILNLVLVKYSNGNNFLAVDVREFTLLPHVCKKDGPQSSTLRRGTIYVRPPGFAQTTEIRSAEDLQNLLELAAEKRARNMIEMARRIGVETAPPSRPFDEELGGL